MYICVWNPPVQPSCRYTLQNSIPKHSLPRDVLLFCRCHLQYVLHSRKCKQFGIAYSGGSLYYTHLYYIHILGKSQIKSISKFYLRLNYSTCKHRMVISSLPYAFVRMLIGPGRRGRWEIMYSWANSQPIAYVCVCAVVVRSNSFSMQHGSIVFELY